MIGGKERGERETDRQRKRGRLRDRDTGRQTTET